MLRSMTGFARSERATEAVLLAWEIRSVNHRYLEVSLRLPEDLRGSEAEYRRAIGAVARRGKVDASLYLRPVATSGRELTLDEAMLDRLIEQATAVRRKLGAEGRIDAVDLLRWPGVVREAERDTAPLAAAAMDLLAETLESFTTNRAAEGERIAQMLSSRASQVSAIVEDVRSRLPEVQSRIRVKLQERLATLGAEGNPDRLEQEIAILVQKMDVAEELDRLRQSRRGNVDDARLGRSGRQEARFPDAGVQPRGEHAFIQVSGRGDDEESGRAEGPDRTDAGAGAERRIVNGVSRWLNQKGAPNTIRNTSRFDPNR